MAITNTIEYLNAHGMEVQKKGASIPLVSFGKLNKEQSFVSEKANAHIFGFSIKNDSSRDILVCVGGFQPGRNNTIFDNGNDLLTKVGADCLLADGVIFQNQETPGSTFSGDVTVSTVDSKRSVDELIRYACVSPTRVAMMKLRSSKKDGTNESTNYNNRIKSQWYSPLIDTVSQDLDLAPLQKGGDNFRVEMLDVDFRFQEHSFIISNENFNVIQVNAGTTLSISMYVGAQISNAQTLYRLADQADKVIVPVQRGY